jgi:hypothetical protein
MARIALCTAVYKRPEVFSIFLDCWQSLPEPPDIYVAGSEGDLCEEIAHTRGCYYVKTKNAPVGAKWNMAHELAGAVGYDYYLTTGSDDVMDARMWEFYRNYTGQRLALSDLYFIELDGRALYWNGYDAKHPYVNFPIGAHQLTRHDIMEAMQFKPFLSDRMAHEHDTHKMAGKMGVKSDVVPMWFTSGMAVDVKSKGSYTQLRQWKNSAWIPIEKLRGESPDLVNLILK